MNSTRVTKSVASRIVLIAATLTFGACDKVDEIINDINSDGDAHYYLSLGTSLSIGVQPNGSGIPLPTSDGYADQLFDSIKPAFDAAGAQPRELQLNRLGCAGETLDSMVNGGSCLYFAGSQLDAAVDFLTDNVGKVHLVTIDMGGNDFRNAGCIGATVDLVCVNAVSDQIATDLASVLTTLSNAAGPNTTIIGVNYYNPYLSAWLVDAAGQTLAMEAAQAVALMTNMLSTTYGTAGIPVADVAAEFQSDEFTIMVPNPLPGSVGDVPLSVANICDMTYQCSLPPEGPDIHANPAGYGLMAATIEAILP